MPPMLAIELVVEPLLRGYFCGAARGDSVWPEYCDREGFDALRPKLSEDSRGLAEAMST